MSRCHCANWCDEAIQCGYWSRPAVHPHDGEGHLLPLPPGITGFYRPPRDPLPPSVDPRVFKAVCFAVARQAQATVTRFLARHDTVLCNYHTAVLCFTATGMTVEVRCNAHYPLVACVDPRTSPGSPLGFVQVPVLTPALAATPEFTLVEVAYLRMYPTAAIVKDLTAAEHQQIHYWKPAQVGDIIYNLWD